MRPVARSPAEVFSIHASSEKSRNCVSRHRSGRVRNGTDRDRSHVPVWKRTLDESQASDSGSISSNSRPAR